LPAAIPIPRPSNFHSLDRRRSSKRYHTRNRGRKIATKKSIIRTSLKRCHVSRRAGSPYCQCCDQVEAIRCVSRVDLNFSSVSKTHSVKPRILASGVPTRRTGRRWDAIANPIERSACSSFAHRQHSFCPAAPTPSIQPNIWWPYSPQTTGPIKQFSLSTKLA
jgi:hypothetical protein